MPCPAQMLGYHSAISRSRSAAILAANLPFALDEAKTSPGSCRLKNVWQCHSACPDAGRERGVPRFFFCAKRQDTESRIFLWTGDKIKAPPKTSRGASNFQFRICSVRSALQFLISSLQPLTSGF